MLLKINNYLVTNKPIYFQTKFLHMLFGGIFLWIFSFLIGYACVTKLTAQEHSIDQFYYRYFLVYHSIISTIIYIIWAVKFFRNNALKQIYPMSRNYILKMYLQIAVPMLVIISVYYPFTWGTHLKMQHIYSQNELKNDAAKLNEAYPFFVHNIDNYNISNKVYPSPFPLESFNSLNTNTANETGWNYEEVYYKPEIKNGLIDTSQHYFSPDSSTKASKIRNINYLFYTFHTLETKLDSCHSYSYKIIDSFIYPDEKLINSRYAVQHFSSLLIQPNYFDDICCKNSIVEIYKKHIAPEVYKIIITKDTFSVQKRIDNFLSVCKKYEIKYIANSKKITDSLLANNFMIDYELTTKSENDLYTKMNISNAEKEINQGEDNIEETIAVNTPNLYSPVAFIDFDNIKTIYSNFDSSKNTFHILKYSFIGFLIASFTLSMLFLLIYSINRISFIISIPVLGVICMISGLLASGMFSGDAVCTLFLFISAIFYGLGWFAVRNNDLSKNVCSVIVALSFYAVIALGICIIMFIYFLSVYHINICGHYETKYAYDPNPWHAFFLTLFLFILSLPMLKKLRAKAW